MNRLFRQYRILYRRAFWLISRAGPLELPLIHLGRWVHGWLFPRSFYATLLNPLSVDGLCLYHTGGSEAHLLASGLFDLIPRGLLEEIIEPGMTVLDVGANIGYFSLLAARLVGSDGMVWAFEPAPPALDVLWRNIAANGFDNRICVIPAAVSDVSGPARMHVDLEESMFSTLHRDATGVQAEIGRHYQHCDVLCVSLDEWAEQQNWPAVDLVKIDIEGGEVRALRGMYQLSQRNPKIQVLIEFNELTLRAAGATIEEFFAALDSHGFRHIYVVERAMKCLDLATDVPWLVREAHRGGNALNLLCTRDPRPVPV